MKGQVLHYDDNAGVGQISGADGIRYNFGRGDLKRLVPITAGTEVDFDFEGKNATDIYVVSSPAPVMGSARGGVEAPYSGAVEPDLGIFGYFTRAITGYYFNFSGRARRKEYWSFILVPMIVYLVGGGVIGGFGAAAGPNGDLSSGAGIGLSIVMVLLGIFALAILIPTLAMYVRRLHDLGQSGWLVLVVLLVSLIPFVGIVAFILLGCIDSQRHANKFGPPPKSFA